MELILKKTRLQIMIMLPTDISKLRVKLLNSLSMKILMSY